MEAQTIRFVLTAAAVLFLGSLSEPALAQHPRSGAEQRVETENFVVFAADARYAQRVAREAERYRRELAMDWLGYELGPWRDKCPIRVQIGMHAGGETSFAFITNGQGKGIPVSWQMKIFGPPDRLLDAVLPHEITHTIFATHFGRPLPRWADEGACTTVEHESERKKNHRMLIQFLNARPSRGIAFNRMFTMRNYPHDILPLYAQGYSLAKYLIMQKGKSHFLKYLAAGMKAEVPGRELKAWDWATQEFYGYENLSELQVAWIAWVKNGSRDLGRERLADASTRLEQTFTQDSKPEVNSAASSWYEAQMGGDPQSRIAANRASLQPGNEGPRPSKSAFSGEARLDLDANETIWR